LFFVLCAFLLLLLLLHLPPSLLLLFPFLLRLETLFSEEDRLL